MCVCVYQFLRQGILTTYANPQSGGPPLFDCLQFPFQYIRRYSPHLTRLLHPQPVDACHVLMTSRLRLKCDGTRAETRFCLSAKRTSPFKPAGASIQLNTGSRGVRISGSNAVYTVFLGSVRVLATHSIRQFPLHFPSHASLCAIKFQTDSTHFEVTNVDGRIILKFTLNMRDGRA
jgi:hypothetical protein